MKLGTIAIDAETRAVSVDEDGIRSLLTGKERRTCVDTRMIFEQLDGSATPDSLTRGPLMRDGSEPKWLPPVLRPEKIICVWANYFGGRVLPKDLKAPIFFAKYANSLLGAGGAIVLPEVSSQVGWEPELAVVIGRRADRVSIEDALSFVGGYTIANDVTAFDHSLGVVLGVRGPYMIAKCFDSFCPLGPYLVSPDEVGDPGALRIRLWLDDELRVDASTAEMVFSVARIISYLSWRMTLQPGDVILTGTPPLDGDINLELRLLKSGQTVRIEIEKIGSLTNSVIAQEPKL